MLGVIGLTSILMGCSAKSIDNMLMATSGNARTFDGQRYNLLQANLGGNPTTYVYGNDKEALVIQRHALNTQLTFEQFVNARLQEERINRQNDCQIQSKSHSKGAYYFCQYTNIPANVIYTFSQDGNYGYLKIFTDKAGTKDIAHKAGKLIEYDVSYLSK